MKKLPYILLVLALAMLTTCTKKPELKVYILELGAVDVEVTSSSVTVSADYSYPTEIGEVRFLVSGESGMGGALESEAEVTDTKLTGTVTGLLPSTKYYFCFKYNTGVNLDNTKPGSFTTKNSGGGTGELSVTTLSVASITATTAVSGGNVTGDGGYEVTKRGVCWNTNGEPTIADSHTEDGTGSGVFLSNLTGLESGTEYHVRAYAINEMDTVYGETLDFTTQSSDGLSVTTLSVASVTTTTAVSGGNVTGDGGYEVTKRGVCWNKEGEPTIADSRTEDGTGTGVFLSNLTGLEPSTEYHLRAYAINEMDTVYGETLDFTTQSNDGLSVTTLSVASVTTTTAVSGGNVTGDGGYEVTKRGVCWNKEGEPTIADSRTEDGTGTGVFLSNLIGLEPGTEYHVRAYAINEMDTVYGETLDFATQSNVYGTVVTTGVSEITMTSAKASGNVTDDGGVSVFERGICWDTVANPTIEKHKIPAGSGMGAFTCNITDLTLNSTYHVRAYATNTYGTNYGDDIEFTTLGTIPVVVTGDVSDITSASARVSGNVINDWGSNITERGICYSTSENPTIDNNKVTAGTGVGDFECQLTNLTLLTTYYARAYATNEYGTNYGDEVTFTTLDALHIYTYDVNINETDVVFNGEVAIDEGSIGNIGNRGFCFAIHSNPTNDDNIVVVGSGVGVFSKSITKSLILCNLTYYVRSWVMVNNERVYGNEVVFVLEAPQAPTGALSGLFSISKSKQVWFSKGNLQYQASTDTWRFAEPQYDNIVAGNNNISGTYSGWIDLYGWGTGNNPTYTGGNEQFTNWGINAISNGGATPNIWHTLAIGSWEYMLFTRETPSGIRFAKATLYGVYGLIILPDDWNSEYYNLISVNMTNVDYTKNEISLSDWNSAFESHGAVFLPVTGYRNGTVVSEFNCGYYWSSTKKNYGGMFTLTFNDNSLHTFDGNHEIGMAVRLVQYVQ